MYDITKDLVIFGADWCNECKSVKKLLDEKGQGYTYIDVDSPAGMELAKQEAIRNLPYGLYNGKFVIRNVATAKEFLLQKGSQDADLLKEREDREANLRELIGRVEGQRAELDAEAEQRAVGLGALLEGIRPAVAMRAPRVRINKQRWQAQPLPAEVNALFANNPLDREVDF